MSLHQQRVHPEFVEGCFGCKVGTLRLSVTAQPTRSPEGARLTEFYRREEADMHAYKRLREQGLQPRSIRGSADLEKHGSTGWELKKGRPAKTVEGRKKAKRMDRIINEAGMA